MREELVGTIAGEILEGGAGSGHWGHAGRPGAVGGSKAGRGSVAATKQLDMKHVKWLRAGGQARVLGKVQLGGVKLTDAVIGMAANGNLYVRGKNQLGEWKHAGIGHAAGHGFKFKEHEKLNVRKARPSEKAEAEGALEAGKPASRSFAKTGGAVADRARDQAARRAMEPPAPPRPRPVPTPQPARTAVVPTEVVWKPRPENTKRWRELSDVERQTLERSMESSPVENVKNLGGGISTSYMVQLEDGTQGIFKPVSGEPEVQDIPDYGGSSKREAAAYEIAKVLGMEDMVPPTKIVQLDIPKGGGLRYEGLQSGSLQLFVDGKDAGDFNRSEMFDGRHDAARMAAFDYIIGNTDRHTGNWRLTPEGKLALIDHGHALRGTRDMFRGGNFQSFKHAADEKLPIDRIQKDWSGKWERIEAAMKGLEIDAPAIKGAKKRYDALMSVKQDMPWFRLAVKEGVLPFTFQYYFRRGPNTAEKKSLFPSRKEATHVGR